MSGKLLMADRSVSTKRCQKIARFKLRASNTEKVCHIYSFWYCCTYTCPIHIVRAVGYLQPTRYIIAQSSHVWHGSRWPWLLCCDFWIVIMSSSTTTASEIAGLISRNASSAVSRYRCHIPNRCEDDYRLISLSNAILILLYPRLRRSSPIG